MECNSWTSAKGNIAWKSERAVDTDASSEQYNATYVHVWMIDIDISSSIFSNCLISSSFTYVQHDIAVRPCNIASNHQGVL